MTTSSDDQPPIAPQSPRKRRRLIISPTEPPLIPTEVEFQNDPSELVNLVFGHSIDNGTLAAMANAPSEADACIAFQSVPEGGFQALTTFAGGTATRVFWRHADDGVLEAQNWYFRLFQDESAEGAGDWRPENDAFDGTELFANQVRAMRRVGVQRIWTLAARLDHKDPNTREIGYCVWPRMGFDASIPEVVWNITPPDLQNQVFANPVASRLPNSLMALVSTLDGRSWWTANGVGLECTFDLSTDSPSMRVLADYITRRNETVG